MILIPAQQRFLGASSSVPLPIGFRQALVASHRRVITGLSSSLICTDSTPSRQSGIAGPQGAVCFWSLDLFGEPWIDDAQRASSVRLFGSTSLKTPIRRHLRGTVGLAPEQGVVLEPSPDARNRRASCCLPLSFHIGLLPYPADDWPVQFNVLNSALHTAQELKMAWPSAICTVAGLDRPSGIRSRVVAVVFVGDLVSAYGLARGRRVAGHRCRREASKKADGRRGRRRRREWTSRKRASALGRNGGFLGLHRRCRAMKVASSLPAGVTLAVTGRCSL